uniref:Uncharacterized protein n=1 Tax=Anguilla anguilla TaxID=7936 RepID=A0A0E9W508_ANGAN
MQRQSLGKLHHRPSPPRTTDYFTDNPTIPLGPV